MFEKPLAVSLSIIPRPDNANHHAMRTADRLCVSIGLGQGAGGKSWRRSVGDDCSQIFCKFQTYGSLAQPPLPLAVYLVSAGAAHLRWLAELDPANA